MKMIKASCVCILCPKAVKMRIARKRIVRIRIARLRNFRILFMRLLSIRRQVIFQMKGDMTHT